MRRKELILKIVVGILLASGSYQSFSQSRTIPNGIDINLDTINASMTGTLRKVVQLKSRYYCMFYTNRQNTTKSFKKMIVLDQEGEFVEDVFVPEGIQKMNYFNLIVENDSLFLKRTQFDEATYLLGKYVVDFSPIETRNFPIYQDEDFVVYSTCNGEWGGTIYFQDKVTNQVFEGSSTCSIVVNRINEEYFVTNYLAHMMGHASVQRISDPRELQPSELNFQATKGSAFSNGIEGLLSSYELFIPTSFVVNDELYHLCNNDDTTFIGKIENGEMITVYKFDFNFYSNFCQLTEGQTQVLAFNIPNTENKGILTITNGILNFSFFK